jgi:hypothetical protein
MESPEEYKAALPWTMSTSFSPPKTQFDLDPTLCNPPKAFEEMKAEMEIMVA